MAKTVSVKSFLLWEADSIAKFQRKTLMVICVFMIPYGRQKAALLFIYIIGRMNAELGGGFQKTLGFVEIASNLEVHPKLG